RTACASPCLRPTCRRWYHEARSGARLGTPRARSLRRRALLWTRRPRPPGGAGSAPLPQRRMRGSARRGALGRGVHGVQRLARYHEQPVALGAAEGDVAAHFGQPDAADQLAVRVPHRDPVVADGAAGVAGAPEVAINVGTEAVRTALDAVDHAVGEHPLVRELVVRSDVEDMNVALAGRSGAGD